MNKKEDFKEFKEFIDKNHMLKLIYDTMNSKNNNEKRYHLLDTLESEFSLYKEFANFKDIVVISSRYMLKHIIINSGYPNFIKYDTYTLYDNNIPAGYWELNNSTYSFVPYIKSISVDTMNAIKYGQDLLYNMLKYNE